MHAFRTLTHGPGGEPRWVQLYVRQVGTTWVAMILPDGASPPAPGELKGTVLLAETAEAAEGRAFAFLGKGWRRPRGPTGEGPR